MPRAAAASATAMAIPPRMSQSSFDCLAAAIAFVSRWADLAYLLGVSKTYECRLLIVGMCHLHGAPSRPALHEQLGSTCRDQTQSAEARRHRRTAIIVELPASPKTALRSRGKLSAAS